MKRVFIERLPDVSVIPLLYPVLGADHRESILFLRNAFSGLHEPFVTVVNDPAEADVLLVPHNYSSIRDRTEYFARYDALSARTGKKIVVFAHGDADDAVPLCHATVLRTSQYRYKILPGDVIMPAYTEDLLKGGNPELRPLPSSRPVVGFCGWADYRSPKNRLGTIVGNALVRMRALSRMDSRVLANFKGLTFRRLAIDALRRSDRIEPKIVVRSSYSGHRDTIGLDPVTAREEYVQTMSGSDCCLAVKGDGNYSYRFTEALSLGRVVALVDTECVLPLEDVIDYSSFVIRIDFRDVSSCDRMIVDWFSRQNPETFAQAQLASRRAFTEYLSPPAFLKYAVGRWF